MQLLVPLKPQQYFKKDPPKLLIQTREKATVFWKRENTHLPPLELLWSRQTHFSQISERDLKIYP